MYRIKSLENILSLRFSGGTLAFAVSQQISKEKKSDIAEIKGTIQIAFSTDKFVAYE